MLFSPGTRGEDHLFSFVFWLLSHWASFLTTALYPTNSWRSPMKTLMFFLSSSHKPGSFLPLLEAVPHFCGSGAAGRPDKWHNYPYRLTFMESFTCFGLFPYCLPNPSSQYMVIPISGRARVCIYFREVPNATSRATDCPAGARSAWGLPSIV